jgi:flagellin
MTSILTNIASMSALQTLRSVGASLENTQNQVSSGLRVGKAADSVAYWSISTTMRSDNKAIGSARDAMEVGAAKTDVGYAATTAVIDILNEFKAKLVTAKESSVDAVKIQQELSDLNGQAEAVVNSASFSGVNWLKTAALQHINDTNDLNDTVVSGFVRSSNGSVSVSTIQVDLRTTSMLNVGGGGILQKDDPDYYMPVRGPYLDTFRHNGHEDHAFKGPVTFDATAAVTFDLTVDASDIDAGDTYTGVTVNKSVIDAALGTTDGVIADVAALRRVLQQALDNAGAGGTANVYGNWATSSSSTTRYEIQSLDTSSHAGSSISLSNIASTLDPDMAERFLGLDTKSLLDHDNMLPQATMTFTQPFKVMVDATISFDLSVANAPLTTYVIDRAAVDAALGRTDGMINNATDLATVVQYTAAGSSMKADVSGNSITFRADQADYPGYGTKAVEFSMSTLRPNPPFALRFDLAEIDITSGTFTVDEYLDGVQHMLDQATDSAATMGSIQQALELQEKFASRLGDSLDSGISRLVDADMEDASARLAALQTQQQLAVQALQIANSSSSSLMKLFQ